MRPLTSEDKARLYKIRDLLDKYLGRIVDEPAAMNYAAEVAYEWKPGIYALNDVRQYEGNPYKCVQAHDSTDNPDWTPATQAALWMEYHGTDKESARAWKQSTGAQDMYKQGEWMIWTDGSLYECLSDTTYSPTEFASAWKKYTEDSGEEPSEEPETPTETIPDFVQPTGAENAYNIGDKVKFEGKIYESLINGNTYSPTAYPLGWKEVEE